MTLILHLSDLHLRPGRESPAIGAHPAKVLPPGARKKWTTFLADSLKAMARNIDRLDVIVISGDIVDQAREDGYGELPTVLAGLGDKAPSPENILVVPGNHDLPFGEPPSTPARYTEWIRHTREKGYTTPFLDGIDLGTTTPAPTVPHFVETSDAILLPVNSSNFCGVVGEAAPPEGLDAIAAQLRGSGQNDLAEQVDRIAIGTAETFQRLIQHDLARVSPEQIDLLAERFDERFGGDDPRVKIVVLHHHLLPVTTREEEKAFESLTNLGAVRQFLRQQRIDAVLHGHKHESGVYWDHIYPPGEHGLNDRAWTPLVIASPGEHGIGTVIARLLDVKGIPHAPTVAISRVPGVAGGHKEVLPAPEIAALWRSRMGYDAVPSAHVEGIDFNETYARLRAMTDTEPDLFPLRELVCRIRSPEGCGTLPVLYPDVRKLDPQKWFSSLVSYWQNESSRLLDVVDFNHGQRIYGPWGTSSGRLSVPAEEDGWMSQFKRAADALQKDELTTRAVIELLDPEQETGSATKRYPAFVLVQFLLVRREGRLKLDVVGFFRKQEMRYWWPVNVGELHTIQERMLEELKRRGIRPAQGHLVTISAYAEIGDTLPEVEVPDIDLALDSNPSLHLNLALAVSSPEMVDRVQARASWHDTIQDLRPGDGAGTPLARRSRKGLAEVARHIDALRASGLGDARTIRVRESLAALVDVYELLGSDRAPTGPRVVSSHLDTLEAAVKRALNPHLRDRIRARLGRWPGDRRRHGRG